MPRRPPAAWLAVAGASLTAALGLLAGCATYSDHLQNAQAAVEAGDYGQGVRALDRVLGVDTAEQEPEEYRSDTALAVLERGTLLQSVARWDLSANDFQGADQHLELLDLTQDPVGSIGKYVYSDSAEIYRASPSERLALNPFNLLNYLARGDLQGARVEARRFTVVRDYLHDQLDPRYAHSAFGSYLAGFVFEQLGDAEEALRYYDEALGQRELPGLAGPLQRLAARSSYRGAHLEAWLAAHPAPAGAAPAGGGELLVVVGVGRVPHKVPRRIPVGVAVGMAGTWITGDPRVLEHSVLKVVVYPELTPSNALFDAADVALDQRNFALDPLEDFSALVRREYDDLRPKIIGAALSRMIVRAAAAEGARVAGNQADSAVGLLAALAVEGAMVALDKPDTRSWTFLPAEVYVGRAHVPAGTHELRVTLRGRGSERRAIPVDVPAGGFAAVVVTAPR
jgi:uncharacterized protein